MTLTLRLCRLEGHATVHGGGGAWRGKGTVDCDGGLNIVASFGPPGPNTARWIVQGDHNFGGGGPLTA